MGFFSWMTNDTHRSISNCHSGRKQFDVYMIDNKGNVWHEEDYGGYGIFGGKDYYVLLAEMNGFTGDNEDIRDKGISLEFNPHVVGFANKEVLFPNLVTDFENWEWRNKRPDRCPFQGYFY